MVQSESCMHRRATAGNPTPPSSVHATCEPASDEPPPVPGLPPLPTLPPVPVSPLLPPVWLAPPEPPVFPRPDFEPQASASKASVANRANDRLQRGFTMVCILSKGRAIKLGRPPPEKCAKRLPILKKLIDHRQPRRAAGRRRHVRCRRPRRCTSVEATGNPDQATGSAYSGYVHRGQGAVGAGATGVTAVAEPTRRNSRPPALAADPIFVSRHRPPRSSHLPTGARLLNGAHVSGRGRVGRTG
jgi:hypothetical protein